MLILTPTQNSWLPPHDDRLEVDVFLLYVLLHLFALLDLGTALAAAILADSVATV